MCIYWIHASRVSFCSASIPVDLVGEACQSASLQGHMYIYIYICMDQRVAFAASKSINSVAEVLAAAWPLAAS